MVKVKYEDILNDLVNVIGLFYKVETNLEDSSYCAHKIKTYVINFENEKIDFKLCATYFLNFKSEVDSIKLELDSEGFIDMKKWAEINKERLIGNEDVINLMSNKRLVLENPIDFNSKSPNRR